MNRSDMKFNIKSLVLQRMPKVGQQFRRSLATNMSDLNHDNLVKISPLLAEHRKENEGPIEEIDPTAVVGLMGNFAAILSEGVPVDRQSYSGESWNEEVASFVLEVECQRVTTPFKTTHYIVGYTDRPIPADGSPFDLETVFVINSIHDYQNLEPSLAYPAGESYPSGAFQMLSDPAYCGGLKGPFKHRLRPYEVITAISRRHLSQGMGVAGETIVDLRDIQTGHPEFASYADNDPTIWAQRLLEGHVQMIQAEKNEPPSFQRCESQRLENLARNVSGRGVYQHPFTYSLSRLTGGMVPTTFTLKELVCLDATAQDKVTVTSAWMPENVVKYDSFKECTFNNVVGSYIANSIPAIMAKHGVRIAEFSARSFSAPTMPTITSVDTIGRQLYKEEMKAFIREVRARVFDVLSNQKGLSYWFGGRFDLFGNSVFSLEINRVDVLHFISPTYANAAFSPQVTDDRNLLDRTATDFLDLFHDYQCR
jgi:hypothetical protein